MGSIPLLAAVMWLVSLVTAEVLEQLITWAFEVAKRRAERKAKAKRKR